MSELKKLEAELAMKKAEMLLLKNDIEELKEKIAALKPERKKKPRTQFKIGSKILQKDVGQGKTYEKLPEIEDVELFWNLHENVKNPYYKLEKLKSVSKSDTGLHKVRDEESTKKLEQMLKYQIKYDINKDKEYRKQVENKVIGKQNMNERQKMKELVKEIREQNKEENRQKAIEVKKRKNIWKGGDY